MKKIISCFLFGVTTFNVNSAQMSERVIAEYIRVVSFAPPQYAGVYKFEVLSNGNVQKIDNKKNVKQVAVFSEDIVNKIKLSIDRINSDELIQPGGPLCMDAPSHAINVYRSNGKKMVIWKQENCRDYLPFDHIADNVVSVIKKMANVFDQLDGLNTDNL